MSQKLEYPHKFFDEKNRAVCQVCGKSFVLISPTHLKKHGITYDDYKIRFPEAPIHCDEFIVKARKGKTSKVFVKNELEKFETKIEDLNYDDFEDDIPDVDVPPDDDPTIDKIITVEEETPVEKDFCSKSKNQILEHLKTFFFTNIKKDYMIREFELSGDLIYEFITDFADPVLKVNIEFPNTFWHNRMTFDDPNRDFKLRQRGWKVITIRSRAPNLQQITEALKSL